MKKRNIKKIVDKLPISWSKIFIGVYYSVVYRKEIDRLFRIVDSYRGKIQTGSVNEKNESDFISELKKYCFWQPQSAADKLINSYLESNDFVCLQRNIVCKINSNDVILLCCVKNDVNRIKVLIEHHKKIGIEKFVFVDNMSSDGTLEYLLKMGVDVYQTSDKYYAGAKAAWCRKVWDIYGYDRWYLIVDSDELFSYIGMEHHPIRELIGFAEQHDIERVRCLLLDMYSNQSFFSEADNDCSITETYKYFDKDSYYSDREFRGFMIRGGPRYRIFERDDDFVTPVTKYPLIKVRMFDFWNDHYPWPFYKNLKSDCLSVLRHYKFLPEDKNKYKKIVEEANYYNGSYSYKRYLNKIENDNSLSFYYEDSVKYESSDSLRAISFVKSVFDRDN